MNVSHVALNTRSQPWPVVERADGYLKRMPDHDNSRPWHLGLARFALKLVLIAAIVFAILKVLDWAQEHAEATGSGGLMLGVLAMLLLAYALLLAVPFVPGIEIGVSLLLMKGADVAPFVYVATVLGLSLSFMAGRCVPYRWLNATLADLHLKRACHLVGHLESMTREERLAHLTARLPNAIAPWVRSGRYLLLAALFNIPGNAVLGGGGGIAFVTGFSRLFQPWAVILTIVLAVLPVPLSVWLLGTGVLSTP